MCSVNWVEACASQTFIVVVDEFYFNLIDNYVDILELHVYVMMVGDAGGLLLIRQTSTLSRLQWLWEKPKLVLYTALQCLIWQLIQISIFTACFVFV